MESRAADRGMPALFLVHDEQLSAAGRGRAVRLRVVPDLLAHAGLENEGPPVTQLGS
jgi:hypothetical protein